MNYNIIDADRHVSEPINMWQQYLPEDLRVHAPYLVTQGPSNEVDLANVELYMHGQPLFYKYFHKAKVDANRVNADNGDPVNAAASPAGQLQAMDDTGVHSAILFPTMAIYCVYSQYLEPDLSSAFATAYNNWLYDFCQYDKKRLLPAALISRHCPNAMLSELQRIISFGWNIIVLRPEPILNRTLSHADYAAFWQACADNNISVVIHGGTHLNAPTVGHDRFDSRFGLHACSHPLEAQMAFLSLLEGGVLESHPQLKFAFLEAGASWLPHWLWRLDEICYASMPGEIADRIKMKPSEYFKRQCWVGFELEEPCLREVIDTVGIDRLLFGTDYPHPDHLHFDIEALNSQQNIFSPDELRCVLEDNPKTFYGINAR